MKIAIPSILLLLTACAAPKPAITTTGPTAWFVADGQVWFCDATHPEPAPLCRRYGWRSTQEFHP